MLGIVAVFDADNYSTGGGAEEVALESFAFDGSGKKQLVLEFSHEFVAGSGAEGFIEVFDGLQWQTVHSTTGNSAEKQTLNISTHAKHAAAQVRFRWTGNGAGHWLVDNVIVAAPIVSYSHFQDFDLWTNGLSNAEDNWVDDLDDDFDWTVNSGFTPSSSTGPSKDVSGSGKYVFLEATGASPGDSAVLLSPYFNLDVLDTSLEPKMTWFYNMFGSTMGTLKVYIQQELFWHQVFTETGNQNDVWRPDTQSLDTMSGLVRFRFVGIRGSSFRSDMAIDEVNLVVVSGEDAGITGIISPTSSCGLGSAEKVKVVVKNFGTATLTNVPVSYTTNGIPLANPETFITNILPGDTAHYVFTASANLSAIQHHDISAGTSLNPDDDKSNDSTITRFTNYAEVNAFPYRIDFNNWPLGNGESADNWVQIEEDPRAWTVDSGPGFKSPNTGPGVGDVNGTGKYITIQTIGMNNGDSAVIETPCIDLGAFGSALPALHFYRHMFGTSVGSLKVHVITPKRSTKVLELAGNKGDVWIKSVVDLSAFSGKIRIRFVGHRGGNSSGDISLDNVEIKETTGLDLAVTKLIASTPNCNLSATDTVKVRLLNVGDSSILGAGVSLFLNNVLQVRDTITQLILAGDSLIHTFSQTVDLSDTGDYELFVNAHLTPQDDFDNDTLNAITRNVEVITAADIPYLQTFDGFTQGSRAYIGKDWTSLKGPSTLHWTVEKGATVTNFTGPSGDLNGSGKYVYIDKDLDTDADSAVLMSPCLDLTGIINQKTLVLQFFRNMRGVCIDDVHVDVHDGNSWTRVRTLSGDQDNLDWIKEDIKLDAFNNVKRVRFVAINPTCNQGDASIDHIRFLLFDGADAQVTAITSPNDSCGLGFETVTTTIKNLGDSSLSNFEVQLLRNDSLVATDTVTQSIASGDSIAFSFTQKLSLNPAGLHKISVKTLVTNDDNIDNDTLSHFVKNGLLVTQFPFFQNFDDWDQGAGSDDDGWNNKPGSGPQWIVDDFAAGINNTGPSDDVTGGGKYIYFFSAGGGVDDSVMLHSPCLDISALQRPQLRFFSHMFGAAVGELNVDVLFNGSFVRVFSKVGNQGDFYTEEVVDLSAFKGIVELRFVAKEFVNDTRGEIAIDQVSVIDASGFDIKVLELEGPVSACALSNETVQVRVVNTGDSSFSTIPMAYRINGGSVVNQSFNQALSPLDTASLTFSQTANLSNAGLFQLEVFHTGLVDDSRVNDTLRAEIESRSTIAQFAHLEDFDSWPLGLNDDEGWTQLSNDDADWTVDQAGTPSSNTGPSDDRDGGGRFLFIEASPLSTNDSAVIQSPCIDFRNATADIRINFSYHMFGSNMGTFKVFLEREAGRHLLFSESGDQGDQWIDTSIVLDSLGKGELVHLRFVGIRGNGFRSDMAFDRVSIQLEGAPDLAVVQLEEPASSAVLNATETVKVKLKNLKNLRIENIDVQLIVDGQAVVTDQLDSISAGDSLVHVFSQTADLSLDGAHSIVVIAKGDKDEDATNDTLSQTVINHSVFSIPYQETFDNLNDGFGFQAGWSSFGNDFQWNVQTEPNVLQTNKPRIDGNDGTKYQLALIRNQFQNDVAELLSPVFDLSTIGSESDFLLKFAVASLDDNFGTLQLHMLRDGHTDSLLFEKSDRTSSGIFEQVQLEIDSTTDTVQFKFSVQKGSTVSNFQWAAIDDFRLQELGRTDVSVTAITSPVSNPGMGNETIEVEFANVGQFDIAAASKIPFAYRVNKGSIVRDTHTLTNILPADSSVASFSFTTPFNFSVAGNYEVEAWVELPADVVENNDSSRLNIISVRTVAAFPYKEDFESDNGTYISTNEFEFGEPQGEYIDDAASGTQAFVTRLSGDVDGTVGSSSHSLLSPVFDFTGLSADPILKFAYKGDATSTVNRMHFFSQEIPAVASRKVVSDNYTSINWYNNTNVANSWTGNNPSDSNAWDTAQIELIGFKGKVMRLQWEYVHQSNRGDEGFGIDDIQIIPAPANDVSVKEVFTPKGVCGIGKVALDVDLRNFGNNQLFNFKVGYTVNGGPAVIDTVTDTLQPGDIRRFTFTQPIDYTAAGSYDVVAFSQLTADTDTENDTASGSRVFVSNSISTFPYVEDFESNDGGWRAVGPDAPAIWEHGTPTGTHISNAGSGSKAWVTKLSGDLKNSQQAFLLSPCFDFSALAVDPVIQFLHSYEMRTSEENRLEMSLDGGATWAVVGNTLSDGTRWYNDANDTAWNGAHAAGAGNWELAKHSLVGSAGVSKVRLRFEMSGTFNFDGFEGAGVDSISIALPSEPDLKVLSIEDIECGFGSANTIKTVFANIGGTSVHGFGVDFEINGIAVGASETITDTLDPGDTLAYTFTTKANLSASGNTQVRVFHSLANDSKRDNDTTRIVLHVTPTIVAPHFQLFNRFPKGTVLAENWLQEPEEDDTDVQIDSSGFKNPGLGVTPSGPSTDFTGNGMLLYMDAFSAGENDSAIVYSPCFDITQLTDPKLRFKLHMFVQSNADVNEGSVRVEGLGNSGWQSLALFNENSALPDGTFDMDNDQWDQVEIAIDQLPDITRFRFIFKKRRSGLKAIGGVFRTVDLVNIAIDDVEVTGEVPFDLGVIAIDSPITTCGLGFENIQVRVTNFGTQTVTQSTTIPCNFQVDGGIISTNNLSLAADLNPGDTATLTFISKGDFRVLKTYSIRAWTSLAADSFNNENDTFGLVQFSNINSLSTFPYVTDFELDLNDWTIEGVGNDWERDVADADQEYIRSEFNNTKALITNIDGRMTNQTSFITSPCMDFTSFTNDPRIRFDLIHELAQADIGFLNNMHFRMEISTDAGQSFSVLNPSAHSINFYNDKVNNRFTGTHSDVSMDWINCMNVLDGMAGERSVQVRFVLRQNVNTTIEGIGIDNIVIEESPSIDLATIELLKPDTSFGRSSDSVRIRCINRGVGTLAQGTSITIEYEKNGLNTVTENKNLATNWKGGEVREFVFSTLLNIASDTLYEVQAWIKTGADNNASNDSLKKDGINQQIETIFPVGYRWINSRRGWITYGKLNSWEFGEPSTLPFTNTILDSILWVTNKDGNHNNYERSFLESPVYDFSKVANEPIVAFVLAFKTANADDHVHFEVSLNAGETWAKVAAGDSAQGWYNDQVNQVWTGESVGFGPWLLVENNLVGVKGKDRVKFRFVFESGSSGFGPGIGVDLFNVDAQMVHDLALEKVVNPIPNANIHIDSGLVFKLKNILPDTAFIAIEPMKLKAEVTFPDASVDSFILLVSDTVVAPGKSICFNLDSSFSITDTGTYSFVCSMVHFADSNSTNDSLTFTLRQTKQITPKATFGNPVRDTASRSETNDEWTYYYDNGPDGQSNTDDDILVLGIKLNGNDVGEVGDGVFRVTATATGGSAANQGHVITNAKTGNATYPQNATGWTVMPRYWDVSPTRQPDSAVGIRFFYKPSDLRVLNNTLKDSLSVDTLDAHTDLLMYKISNKSPDPLGGHTGVQASDFISLSHGNAPSTSTWVHGTVNGLHYAEFEVTSFSGGGGGATGDGGSPLPLELLNFYGHLNDQHQAALFWETASEIDIQHFVVQKSFNGLQFESVDTVNAKGGGLYTFLNKTSEHQSVYYRLQIDEYSGIQSFSDIIKLDVNSAGTLDLKVFPNPAHQRVSVLSSSSGILSLHGIDGKEVLQQAYANPYQVEYLDVSQIPPGMYFISITTHHKKIVYPVKLVLY